MTAHSGNQWTFEKEVTEELIEEIKGMLLSNKAYNLGVGYTPRAYATLSTVDSIVSNLGTLLDQNDGDFSDEQLEKFAAGGDDVSVKFRDIAVRVRAALQEESE